MANQIARLIIVVSLLGWATPSFADDLVQTGLFFGANRLGNDVELGNSAFMDQVPDSSFLGGFRASVQVFNRFRIEVEGKFAPTRTPGSTRAQRQSLASNIVGFRAHVLYDLFHFGPVSPFALVGGGSETLLVDAPEDYRVDGRDTDEVVHWGVGTRIDLTDKYGLRVEARQAMTAGRSRRATFTYEVQAGFYFSFGRGAAVRFATKEPDPAIPVLVASNAPVVVEQPDPESVVEQEQEQLTEPAEETAELDESLVQEDSVGTPEEEATLDELRDTIKMVRFAKGSARIRHRSRRNLRRVAAMLQDMTWIEIDVMGHTDTTGNDRGNLALSRKRADYVKWFLVDHGIEAGRVRTGGVGDRSPHSSRRRSKNRRVEIEID